MSVHEKIRLIRETKGLTQEKTAEKLNMSINSYGDIERGVTDVKLSQLEKIADILEIKLSELFELNEKNIVNISYYHFESTSANHFKRSKHNTYIGTSAAELEKQLLVNDLKDKEIALQQREIAYLKEINALLKDKT